MKNKSIVDRLVNARFKSIELLLGFVASNAVTLLSCAEQLVSLAFDTIEIIIGQFAPLFLDLASKLLPIAFDSVPVHLLLPSKKAVPALRRLGTTKLCSANPAASSTSLHEDGS